MRIGLLIYSIGIVMIIHWNWDTLFSNKPIWAVFSVLWTLVVRCFRMGLYYPNSSGLSQVVSWEIVSNNQENPGRHFRFWALLGEIILSRSVKYSDLWCSRSRYDRRRNHGNYSGIQAEALRSRGLEVSHPLKLIFPRGITVRRSNQWAFWKWHRPCIGIEAAQNDTSRQWKKTIGWWIPVADISTMNPSDDWYERTWTVLLCLDRWLRNIVTFQWWGFSCGTSFVSKRYW